MVEERERVASNCTLKTFNTILPLAEDFAGKADAIRWQQ